MVDDGLMAGVMGSFWSIFVVSKDQLLDSVLEGLKDEKMDCTWTNKRLDSRRGNDGSSSPISFCRPRHSVQWLHVLVQGFNPNPPQN